MPTVRVASHASWCWDQQRIGREKQSKGRSVLYFGLCNNRPKCDLPTHSDRASQALNQTPVILLSTAFQSLFLVETFVFVFVILWACNKPFPVFRCTLTWPIGGMTISLYFYWGIRKHSWIEIWNGCRLELLLSKSSSLNLNIVTFLRYISCQVLRDTHCSHCLHSNLWIVFDHLPFHRNYLDATVSYILIVLWRKWKSLTEKMVKSVLCDMPMTK